MSLALCRVQFWDQVLKPTSAIYSPERALIAADSALREAMTINLTGSVQRFAKRGLGPPYDFPLKCAYEEARNALQYMAAPVLVRRRGTRFSTWQPQCS